MIETLRKNTVAIASMLLLAIFSLYVVVQLAPIHVLKDWKLKVPNKVYHVGDTIELESSSIKLRKAGGEAHRTVECNSGKDSVVGYILNNSPAKRPPGIGGSVTGLIIPTNITNTPVTCRVVITVTYTVYGFRKVPEYAVSNNFTIVK